MHVAMNLFALVFFVSVFAAWAYLLTRYAQKKPLLKIESRRDVPWNGFDLALLFMIYLMLNVFAVVLYTDGQASPVPESVSTDSGTTTHPLIHFVLEGKPAMIWLAVVVAVVVAPLVEEILFRLFLQGWLEKVDRHKRHTHPFWQLARWGTMPVVLTSFLFAMMHFRVGQTVDDLDALGKLLLLNAVVGIFTILFGIVWAVKVRGATARDLGFSLPSLGRDLFTGVVAFLAISIPLFSAQKFLFDLFPEWLAVDPIPLFFFSLLAGTLYLRTHRIVPAIALHMSLNGFSMLMLWQMAMTTKAITP